MLESHLTSLKEELPNLFLRIKKKRKEKKKKEGKKNKKKRKERGMEGGK